METAIPYIILSVLILLAIVFVIVALKNKEMKEPDYRMMFWMGLIFIAFYLIGAIFDRENNAFIFMILGIVYTTLGLSKRERWGKPRRVLSEERRKAKVGAVLVGLVLLVIGVLVFMLIGN